VSRRTSRPGAAVLSLGLTASAVTAMSLASRVLALLLLVPAARLLSLSDFGTFSVLLGTAVAVANVLGSAPADVIATAAAHRLRPTRRRVTLAATLLTFLGAAALGAAVSVSRSTPTLPLAVALCTTASVPVVAMSLLRGIGRPVLGAVLLYLVLPLGRCVVAIAAERAGDHDVRDLLVGLAAVGVCVGAGTLVLLMSVRSAVDVGTPGPAPVGRPWLAPVAGCVVSVGWLALAQAGPLALALAAGPAAAATLVPTLRLCDSLTAIGIGYKAAANRSLQSSIDGAFPRGAVTVLLSAFTLTAITMCSIAPLAVPLFFGSDHRFVWSVALLLLAAFALATLIAVKVQLLFAVGAHARIIGASGAAVLVAVVASAIGAEVAGLDGAAAAMFLTTATWFAALTVGRPAVGRC
jgi:O-antigen/teichoic acid export membrane protein